MKKLLLLLTVLSAMASCTSADVQELLDRVPNKKSYDSGSV